MYKGLSFLIFSIVLTACGSGGSSSSGADVLSDSSSAPVIGEILTDVVHLNEFRGGSHQTYPEQFTIGFTVDVEVLDPDGADDLEYIEVTQTDDDEWWTLFEPFQYEPCRVGSTNRYACEFRSSTRLHSLKLHNWKLIAHDKAGNVTDKAFEFRLPGGYSADGYDFVYSSMYTGDKTFGVPALESLEVSSSDINRWVDHAAETIHFDFVAQDSRIDSYHVALWDYRKVLPSDEYESWVYVGYVSSNAPSLLSNPIVANTRVSIDIPWEDVVMFEDYLVEDVSGAHIVVYDEFRPTLNEWVLWSNHSGASEFILINAHLNSGR